jgi:hypothetical protein
VNNSSCAPGLECLDGRCASACAGDNGCNDNQRCVFGFCVLNPECVFNNDCSSDNVCINGSCSML